MKYMENHGISCAEKEPAKLQIQKANFSIYPYI